MIVKDEAAVICRSLSSVKPFIDHWVIVDTGSTDGTQRLIQEYLSDVPGKLHQSHWVNFSYARNEALRLSQNKADYILFIDADEQFLPEPDFSFSFLKEEYYLGTCVIENGQQFQKTLAIKNSPYFLWIGAVHEMIVHTQKICHGVLVQGAKVEYLGGGYRSRDPLTFEKDIILLKDHLNKNPKDSRSLFFLSMTYERKGQLDAALECFEKRALMPESDQEVFFSVLSIGLIQMKQGKSSEIFLETLQRAHRLVDTRPEPIYFMSKTFESQDKLKKAYDLLSPFVYSFNKEAVGCQTFFNMKIVEIEIPILYARICFRLLKYKESCSIFRKISNHPDIAPASKKYIESYLKKFEI